MGKGKGEFTHTHIQNPEKTGFQLLQEDTLIPLENMS
jgi:hypothetical protein